MSKMDKLKEIIRELIQQELREATVTGAIDGGEGPPKTPKAFGNKKKKKKEISTNSTGYNVVNEGTLAVTIDLGRDLGGDGVVIENFRIQVIGEDRIRLCDNRMRYHLKELSWDGDVYVNHHLGEWPSK